MGNQENEIKDLAKSTYRSILEIFGGQEENPNNKELKGKLKNFNFNDFFEEFSKYGNHELNEIQKVCVYWLHLIGINPAQSNYLKLSNPCDVSMRDLPTKGLIQYFNDSYGNPYVRHQNISNNNTRLQFPSEVIESEYPVIARVIEGCLPVGIDDSGAGTKAHSITDAIEGGWGQLRITVYSNRNKTAITGWTLEQYLPGDGEGAALNQPDFEWTRITDSEIAKRLLFNDHDLMADALTEILSKDELKKIIFPYQGVDAISGAAPSIK